MTIISSAVPDPVDDWVDRYQEFVGAIVVLQDPLSCEALARLLGVGVDKITITLSHLHSLLAPTGASQVFQIHHKSFPDFITDFERCKMGPPFFIDPKIHNLRIAKRCLRIMDQCLKQNICDLGPNDWFKDNSQIRHLTQNCISLELAYACTYWASHLNAGGLDNDVELLLEHFSSNHLLAWLEVVSIIGRMETAYSSLDRVCQLIVSSTSYPGLILLIMVQRQI